tara:strand:+ start:2006 stop:3655 length:1650 start_codon:yes stop_codon:yes gene_type:complete
MPIRLSDLRKTADAAIGADGLDSAQITTIASGAGLNYFNTLDSLPISSLSAGDQAFVAANQRLYISNGTGWYNVSLVNLTPQFDSDVNSAFSIVDSQTPLIITNPASDSDNPDAIITYGGTLADSGQYLIALTRDSSVWTFTPLSADSVHNNVTLGNIPDSAGGAFTYTFTATDGINQATKTITITYDGLAASAFSAMGTSFGYVMGGKGPSGPPVNGQNTIQKFSFASDTNATDVGDLTSVARYGAGARNATHGYFFHSGSGYHTTQAGRVEKFSFASDGNAAAVTPISPAHGLSYPGYTSSHREPVVDPSGTNTYFVGIFRQSPPYNAGTTFKFNMTSETGTVTVPGLNHTAGHRDGSGASSSTNGYQVAGQPGAPNLSVIPGYPGAASPANYGAVVLRFPFASEDAIIGVGHAFHANLAGPSPYGSWTHYYATAANSADHIYMFGGQANAGSSNSLGRDFIEKTAFASDGNSSDVGNLTRNLYELAGSSSTTHGYSGGGTTTTNPNPLQTSNELTDIQKFPFASDTNATDTADLAVGTNSAAPTFT